LEDPNGRKNGKHQPEEDDEDPDTSKNVRDDLRNNYSPNAHKDELVRAQVIRNLKSIVHAADLLEEVKDIRDELNILKAIVAHQKKVWAELDENELKDNSSKGAAYFINLEIEEMDKQATRVQSAVNLILDLEQNEASITEAISSREQAQESIQQGRTLLVFTIVTIIFLPMSFLASLFALNVSSFPRSNGDVLYSPGWIFPILFGVTAAISIPLVLLAAYVDSVRRLFSLIRRSLNGELANNFFKRIWEFVKGKKSSDNTAGNLDANNGAQEHKSNLQGAGAKKVPTSDSDTSTGKPSLIPSGIGWTRISWLWGKLRRNPEEVGLPV